MGNPGERGPSVANESVTSEVKNGLQEGKVDAALEFLHSEDTGNTVEISEKHLVRKIDWMIMPLMWAAYNLQYLDKVLSKSDERRGREYPYLMSEFKSTMPP